MRVVCARGPDGLTLVAPGTDPAESFTRAGWQLAAPPGQGPLQQTSLDEIRALDPDVIVFTNPAMRTTMTQSQAWRSSRAVRDGHAFIPPDMPFGWLDEPPYINRLLGLGWLGGADLVRTAGRVESRHLSRRMLAEVHSSRMSPASRIVPLPDLPSDVEALRTEAAAEGFRFMDKLVVEWRFGTNRFARPGEVFLGAFWIGELVAVGGLNRDPYVEQDGIGRLRHIYVRKSARRSGVGSALVRQLLSHAEGTFHSVRLRTKTREAADFYVSLGFSPVRDEAATHVRSLRRS